MRPRIPLLTTMLERCARRRLRSVMRGYRLLRDSDQLAKITEVKDALTNTRLSAGKGWVSAHLFGAGLKDAELIVRQYLLVRVGGLDLNKSLLGALGRGGSVVHPLPSEWRVVLEGQGFKVARLRSAVAWNGFLGLLLGYGFFSLIKRNLGNLKAMIRRASPSMGRYVYFDTLGAGNLPQPGTADPNHDVISWYQQWPGRVHDLDAVCHNVAGSSAVRLEGVAVRPVSCAIMPLGRLHAFFAYATWSVGASLLAVLDLLRGRWWHALLLNEATKSAQVRLQDTDRLALDYLFHNSVHIYRPLWTYEAAQKGVRVSFYFYSTNCESFKRRGGYGIQANSWQLANWPLYLVWDEGQADFVRRTVSQFGSVQVVGPIWFHGSSAKIPVLPPQTIAVFDVQPVRAAFYSTLGLPLDYYTPETVARFLGDIHERARGCGAKLAFKRKRKIGRLAHPAYRKLLGNFDAVSTFIAIDPDTSALRIIEKSMAVISMPFTSTALIARGLNKPTCYYDPTGLVQKDDRAAHGIEIISGREELFHWLGSVMTCPTEGKDSAGLKAAIIEGQKSPGLIG